MANLSGMEIGNYRITERIGRGGMAEVYLGVHKHLDRQVAIKVLHGHLLDGGDFLTRFKREAKAVANLRHPNIVQVHDFDIQDEIIFMVMDFIDGNNLQERLVALDKKGERLSIKQIGSIINDVGGALDYAHSKGMLHRDVKPSNILLDSNGKAYLTDFGIARILSDQKLTATGTLIGTPAYMSPEQGSGEELSRESDIYSLGVVAFEMITGQVPYDARTPIAIVHKQISSPIPHISELVDDVPGSTQEVIDTALAKSPDKRYSSAEALVRALRAALSELESADPSLKRSAPVASKGEKEECFVPTVEMQDAPAASESDQPTVLMEDDEQLEELEGPVLPERAVEDAQELAAEETKRKFPKWGVIVGGVALVAIVGVVLTQVFDLGQPQPEPDATQASPASTLDPVPEVVVLTQVSDLSQPGTEPEPPQASPTSTLIPIPEILKVVFDADHTSNGLSLDSGGYTDTMVVTVGESQEQAWRTGNRQILPSTDGNRVEDWFMQFQVDDDFIYRGSPTLQVRIEIEYLDDGTDTFILQYDATSGGLYEDGRFKASDIVTKTDSGEFKIAVFTLSDAYFANRDDGADFRIHDLSDGPETIRSVTIELTPNIHEVLRERGILKSQTGDLNGALDDLNQALEINPEDPIAYRSRSLTYSDLGNVSAAVDDAIQAIRLEPDYIENYLTLIAVYTNIGDPQLATETIEALDRAVELDPTNLDIRVVRGEIYWFELRDELSAQKEFDLAIQYAQPGDVGPYNNRALFYVWTGQCARAVWDYTRYINVVKHNPYVYQERGDCYAELGEDNLAREDYKTFMTMTDGNPELDDIRQIVQSWLDAH